MLVFYRDKGDIQDLTIEYIAMERLERLLDKYDDVSPLLQGYIRKKTLPDFERLTHFMRNLSISRTTNPVESQTDPDQIKKRYKTVWGILSYLAGKVEYWTKRFGRTQHAQKFEGFLKTQQVDSPTTFIWNKFHNYTT